MYKHYTNGFYVSDSGKVKRVRNDKVVKVNIQGRFAPIYYSANEVKPWVAKLFIPKPSKSKYIVDHINRNRIDNRVVNLRWVDHSENMINRDI